MYVSETGSSVAMEKEGLKQSLDKLLNHSVDVLSVATDRQTYWCGLPDEKMLLLH